MASLYHRKCLGYQTQTQLSKRTTSQGEDTLLEVCAGRLCTIFISGHIHVNASTCICIGTCTCLYVGDMSARPGGGWPLSCNQHLVPFLLGGGIRRLLSIKHLRVIQLYVDQSITLPDPASAARSAPSKIVSVLASWAIRYAKNTWVQS